MEQVFTLYKRRWTFETGMHDAKESFGFDHYQVRSKTAIERHAQLSFLAASLLQLLTLPAFLKQTNQKQPNLKKALDHMNITWYHPARWTLGLTLRYLKWTSQPVSFSSSNPSDHTSGKYQEPTYHDAAG